MTDIEEAMDEIAEKARAKAEELDARAARLRALIADTEFLRQRAEAHLARQAERYWWELDEESPSPAQPKIWAAIAADFATGEGWTRHLLVTLCRSEAEFRRAFARRTNRELANAAALDESIREFMERAWSCRPRPAALSLYITAHQNFS
jgi:hypothetical protein